MATALEAWLEAGRLLEHLPGLHDQKSHGRRFRIPGDPKSGLRKALKATTGKPDRQPEIRPVSVADLQASQDDYLKRTGAHLTEDQRFALKAYSLAGYERINGFLRGRKGYEDPAPQVRQAVDDLRATMVPLQEDAVFERGADWALLPEGFRDPESAKRLVGKTVSDPGFMSTSVPGARLAVRGGRVHLTVEAPKGTKGRLIRDMSEIHDEDEYLLEPGTRFRIVEVSGEEPTRIRVRVVV